jgi:5'-3' exoribonuclease 2
VSISLKCLLRLSSIISCFPLSYSVLFPLQSAPKGNDFLPHLPSLDIRDGAIDFLIESYKEMLPSLGNYITSPGGTVNLQQADVILGRVGEVEDEVFRRKKGSEDQEERRRASFTKVPRGSGPGGVILAPKDRAKAEAASMLAMVQQGQVTIPLPPRPTSQYRSDHPQTAAESKIAGETPASAQSVAAGNKEAAMKLKGSILGKRSTTARPTTDDTEVDVKKEANLEIKSEVIDGSEDIKTEIAGAEMEVKEEEVCFEEEVKVEAVPLTPAEALKTKEDIKKRMKAKESEMIDGYKKSLKDTVCLHESGWKSRYHLIYSIYPPISDS